MGDGERWGFVAGRFPGRTENFILREILEIRERRPESVVFCLERRGGEEHLSAEEAARLSAVRQVEVRLTGARELARHALWCLRRPVRALRLARTAFGLADGGRLGSAAGLAAKAAGLAMKAERDGITHLHACFANHIADAVYLAARALSLSYTVSAHAHDIWARRPNEKVMEGARCCIACTEAGREELARMFPAAMVTLVRHGIVAVGDGGQKGRRSRSASRDLRLIGAGRFVAKKGFDTLIDACAELRDRGVKFQCEIYGEGPEGDSLQRQIDSLALGGNVRILPFAPFPRLCEVLAGADFCVLPCRVDPATRDRDGVPNILLEAMNCGAIVVASGLPPINELIAHGRSGYIAPSGDAGALAEVLLKAVSEENRWPEIRRAAREKLRLDYDCATNARQFERAIAGNPDRRPGTA